MLRFLVTVRAPDEALVVLSEDLDPQAAIEFVQAAVRLLLIQGPGWSLTFKTNDPEETE